MLIIPQEAFTASASVQRINGCYGVGQVLQAAGFVQEVQGFRREGKYRSACSLIHPVHLVEVNGCIGTCFPFNQYPIVFMNNRDTNHIRDIRSVTLCFDLSG